MVLALFHTTACGQVAHEAQELTLLGSETSKNHLLIRDVLFKSVASVARGFDFQLVLSLVLLISIYVSFLDKAIAAKAKAKAGVRKAVGERVEEGMGTHKPKTAKATYHKTPRHTITHPRPSCPMHQEYVSANNAYIYIYICVCNIHVAI